MNNAPEWNRKQMTHPYGTTGYAKEHPLNGKHTYDGTSAGSQGSYNIQDLAPSKRLQTLVDAGATLGLSSSDEAGAWFGNKVAVVAFDECEGWNWDKAERDYIFAHYAMTHPKQWEDGEAFP